MVKAVFSKNAPQPIGAYSQAVACLGFVFVSGQIALDKKSGSVVKKGIETQTAYCLNSLCEILKEAGSATDKVVKTTIYLSAISNFPSVNRVYSNYFKKPFPARSVVEVSGLPRGALVEIEAIATL